MARASLIFVGFEIDESIEQALAGCREADRVYIDDPAYLDRAVIDGQSYIGKPLGDNAALDRIEDAARNVVSLLARIGPELRLVTGDVRLIAGESEDAVSVDEDQPDPVS